MKNLLVLLVLIPLMAPAQQAYDTIFVVHYVSNPPTSDWMCDSLKCEGECEAYFENGNLFRKGTFRDGQPAAPMYTYQPNGQLQEVFFPNEKGWRNEIYHPNGQLASEYDVLRRSEREYDASGNLRLRQSWDRRFRMRSRRYNAHGKLILKENRKRQNRYDDRGKLVESIKRKDISGKDLIELGQGVRIFEYTWKASMRREVKHAGFALLETDLRGRFIRMIARSSKDICLRKSSFIKSVCLS